MLQSQFSGRFHQVQDFELISYHDYLKYNIIYSVELIEYRL